MSWFAVLLAGEYAETSELFGPFQSERRANRVRDHWNREHPDDRATVLPILPDRAMRKSLR